MRPLERIIRQQIIQFGPIDIGQFMTIALGHEDHGYYMKKDPLGGQREKGPGDFVTAPEVSQMFGEILGAWAAYQWQQLGEPEEFILLECGPGRGTLMADVLRATQNVEGFHAACRVHLLEMSPVLQGKQNEALRGFVGVKRPVWHEHLESVPTDIPMIVLANEFFDALPFRQLVFKNDSWHERMVAFEALNGDEKHGEFVFTTRPCPRAMWPAIGGEGVGIDEGSIYEFSPTRSAFMEALSLRMRDAGGAALIIDYGHAKTAFGNTFQAVMKHGYVSVLEHIGDADLTSHVDFEALYAVCHAVLEEESDYNLQPLMEQGAFLKAMGIEERAAYLQQQAQGKYAQSIARDLERLTGPDQMGRLFKVMDLQVKRPHHNGEI